MHLEWLGFLIYFFKFFTLWWHQCRYLKLVSVPVSFLIFVFSIGWISNEKTFNLMFSQAESCEGHVSDLLLLHHWVGFRFSHWCELDALRLPPTLPRRHTSPPSVLRHVSCLSVLIRVSGAPPPSHYTLPTSKRSGGFVLWCVCVLGWGAGEWRGSGSTFTLLPSCLAFVSGQKVCCVSALEQDS